MKKAVLLACAALLPMVIFANVWQAARYARLKDEVESKTQAQAQWLEQNKRLITGLAVLSSPERIEKIARDEFKLEKIQPERSRTVEFSKPGDLNG
jgi:cell division protein FtsL